MIGQVAGLGDFLTEGRQLAARRGCPVLVSWTQRAPQAGPLDALYRARSLATERIYWEGTDGPSLTGVGACAVMPADPVRAGQAWRELLAGAVIAGEDAAGVGPVLLGSFPFNGATAPSGRWSPLAVGSLIVPTWQITSSGDRRWLTINACVSADAEELPADRLIAGGAWLTLPMHKVLDSSLPDEPLPACGEPPDGWVRLVEQAKDAIQRGEMEKVVLARSFRMIGPEMEPAHVLARLRARYPGCTHFAVAHGDTCFLGATPERLVRLQRGYVQVDALAGSARRGVTDEEDLVLGQGLLASGKDRAEHGVVVRTVREALADCCQDLSVPVAPELMRLPNVQHLHTPISGRLLTGEGVLGLVDRLHPTPAVSGFPRSAAMRFLREYERLDRGLYAGPVGWVDQHGEGEFSVALRSALLSGGAATLYAGCGIMANSDPRREWEESCLKLRPMLAALVSRS